MSTRPQTRESALRNEDIDLLSSWLDEVQVELGVERRDRMRVRLLVEDLLIRVRNRLGEDARVTLTCGRRTMRPVLQLEFAGEPYNPLGSAESELGNWESSLCTSIGLRPLYSREHDRNVLRLALPVAGVNPVLMIAASLVAGIACGALGLLVMSEGVRGAVTHVFLDPAYLAWNRILNGISAPIIFLTVATTVLNTQRIDERGGSSLVVIARYFCVSFVVVAAALLCALPLFVLRHEDVTFDAEFLNDVLTGVLEAIPPNIVEPFATSNTVQLLVLAFALGYVLVRLGDRASLLTEGVRQANEFGLQLAEWVSRLVPVVSGLFVCLRIWEGENVLIARMWLPLLTALAISLVVMVLVGLRVALGKGLAPVALAKKLWKPFEVAVRTGSLGASFAEAQRSCTELLGIDADYVRVALPQGLVLYMPISAIGTIVFTLFVARSLGVQGNAMWYLTAVVLAVVVFVATPPVPGANLLAYVALFLTLRIPVDVLVDAMIFDIVFGIFAGAANQTMLQLEMLGQADRFGLLDRDALRG